MRRVLIIDDDRTARLYLRALLAKHADLEIVGEADAVETARALLARNNYDLVFLDPPYRHAPGLGPELSAALGPVLTPGARVLAESDRRAPLELELELFDERRYGDTLIRIHTA